VGLVALSQAEGAAEVAGEHVDLLDVGDQGLVDGLLVSSAAAGDLLLLRRESALASAVSSSRTRHRVRGRASVEPKTYLGLLSLLEESLLAGLLLGLLGGEVLGLGDLLDLLLVQAGDVDLVGGGDDVSGVDPSQGNTVDLEGAGDEEDTLVEGLEKDDALATETTGEDDQDGAGLQRLARGPGADGLADLLVAPG